MKTSNLTSGQQKSADNRAKAKELAELVERAGRLASQLRDDLESGSNAHIYVTNALVQLGDAERNTQKVAGIL